MNRGRRLLSSLELFAFAGLVEPSVQYFPRTREHLDEVLRARVAPELGD